MVIEGKKTLSSGLILEQGSKFGKFAVEAFLGPRSAPETDFELVQLPIKQIAASNRTPRLSQPGRPKDPAS